MGIDYLVCKSCGEAFPDVIDYGYCGNCKEVVCEYCKDKMIEKYGIADENSKFSDDYGEDNPVKCDSCVNPTVTISKGEYDRLLDREYFLECLESAGVDNWGGFSDAYELYREDDE